MATKKSSKPTKAKRATPAKAPTPAEKKRIEAANPAPKKSKKPAAPKIKATTPDAPARRLSLIDAAHRLLAETRQPMDCKSIVAVVHQRGWWSSPAGKTPSATLYSAILREITTKGDGSRFRKTDRGRFAASA